MKSKAAYFGVFTALALIFSYVESLISIPFKVPGVKLGLANLVIVVVLYKMGIKGSLYFGGYTRDFIWIFIW